METRFTRTKFLLGESAVNRLQDARVIVFGIGGVGGYTVEALVRSGIGHIDIVDNDKVSITNINRQIIATTSSIGRYKTEVMKERILDINPQVEVKEYRCFFLPENRDEFDFGAYDYVVDAVDTVTAKIAIIEDAKKAGVPVISCMGAGNKLDATQFQVADISKTSVCPLAKVMRRELKKRDIGDVKVVFSKEMAMTPETASTPEISDATTRRSTPGSVSYVPSVAGLIMAGEIIKDLCNDNEQI